MECNHILMLPNELLVLILKRLSLRRVICDVSPVCKKLHEVAHSSSLWRHFGLAKTNGLVKYNMNSFNAIIVKHAKDFQYLYFNGNFEKLLEDTDIEYVLLKLGRCINLATMDISTNRIVTNLRFLSDMAGLTILRMEHCTELEPHDATEFLSTSLFKLNELNMRYCSQFSKFDIVRIALKHRDSLKVLLIDQVDDMDMVTLLTLLEKLSKIELIKFSPDINDGIETWLALYSEFAQTVILDMDL